VSFSHGMHISVTGLSCDSSLPERIVISKIRITAYLFIIFLISVLSKLRYVHLEIKTKLRY